MDATQERARHVLLHAPEGQAEGSSLYARGRIDGYALGVEHGEQNAKLSSACWAFAPGMVLMAAILSPWVKL